MIPLPSIPSNVVNNDDLTKCKTGQICIVPPAKAVSWKPDTLGHAQTSSSSFQSTIDSAFGVDTAFCDRNLPQENRNELLHTISSLRFLFHYFTISSHPSQSPTLGRFPHSGMRVRLLSSARRHISRFKMLAMQGGSVFSNHTSESSFSALVLFLISPANEFPFGGQPLAKALIEHRSHG